MTRKDYERIAKALADAHAAVHGLVPEVQSRYHSGIDWATSSIADALEAENPRFDRNRFLDAANHGDGWTGK